MLKNKLFLRENVAFRGADIGRFIEEPTFYFGYIHFCTVRFNIKSFNGDLDNSLCNDIKLTVNKNTYRLKRYSVCSVRNLKGYINYSLHLRCGNCTVKRDNVLIRAFLDRNCDIIVVCIKRRQGKLCSVNCRLCNTCNLTLNVVNGVKLFKNHIIKCQCGARIARYNHTHFISVGVGAATITCFRNIIYTIYSNVGYFYFCPSIRGCFRNINFCAIIKKIGFTVITLYPYTKFICTWC